jgi:dTDP-4-dehydrorhamnose reductase
MLGREICRAATGTGTDVRPTSREPAAGWLAFDARSDDPRALFGPDGVDVVVNCAGVLQSEITSGLPGILEDAEVVNAVFPHRLAEAAAETGAQMIHISTDAVFAATAGPCDEDGTDFATDIYGSTKRRGEPRSENGLTLRVSFIGRDPARGHGMLEWLLRQPAGSTVPGFTDHLWNGLIASQVGSVCAALVEPELFRRARVEGPVHHVSQDPVLTKYELLAMCARIFQKPVVVAPVESERPVSRLLRSRYSVIADCLESAPTREAALALLVNHDTK